METKTKELEVLQRLADDVHASAEMASALYEQDRIYRREDLHRVLDTGRLAPAQMVAKLFLKAAQQRDAQHLRALFDVLFDACEARRKRRIPAKHPLLIAAGLGISGDEYFRRVQRMNEIVAFLVMEILCIAFELMMSRERDSDFGGGATAVYLVNTVPELRAPCPIQEDQGDVDQEDDYDRDGQR